MEHKTVVTERGTVHYWVAGKTGSWVVMLHGATMDHDLFLHQAGSFSTQHRVLVWDSPAHGLSRPYQDFSLPHAMHALVEILNAEQVGVAHFVGQSMGCYILQLLALEHPSRMLSLTSVGGSPLAGEYYSAMDRWLLKITPALLQWYPYSYLIRTIAKNISATIGGQEYALKALATHSKQAIADIMGAVYHGLQVFPRVFKSTVPLLITFGEHDRSGKVQTYSIEWAKKESLTPVVIPGAAHNANMDNPGFFNQVLNRFIQTIDFPLEGVTHNA